MCIDRQASTLYGWKLVRALSLAAVSAEINEKYKRRTCRRWRMAAQMRTGATQQDTSNMSRSATIAATRTLSTAAKTMSKFYSFNATKNNGEPFPMADLKGKVVLIINTASKCGFTKQYADLEELYKKYHDQGLEVIGFPCNQFAGQEPGSSEEIAEFCKINFGVSFPIMQKVDVNGDKADPLWEWLKAEKPGLLGFKGIKWNFEKFLVDKEGKVVQRYSSIKNPASISGDIEKLLK